MHGHVNLAEFLGGLAPFLGCYYLALALMNGVMAVYLWLGGHERRFCRVPLLGYDVSNVMAASAASLLFTMISPLAFSGSPQIMGWISFPQFFRDWADYLLGPVVYSVGVLALLTLLFVFRKYFVPPTAAWVLLNASLLAMGLAMTDYDFASIVTKPDNVPIVGMVFLLGFFTWLAAYKAVLNDERAKRNEEPLEKLDNEKILVWPDLVYTELICMVALTALLILWGIALQAPLEEPASAAKTPNPSKAPWYFLGLQEMLVYYDPWMAGVVLPTMVLFGLAAIPYLDFNKKGNGYYTIEQRWFSYVVFQFGFLVLWIMLIVMGTFMRGPNWSFFGVFETWDPHKVEALNNVDLSEYVWIGWLGRPRPMPAADAGVLVTLGTILQREFLGIVLLLGWLVALPPLLVLWVKFFRDLFVKMGFIRYMIMMNLLSVMALLPIKMVCRWSMNMKYFVAIPEFFLNF